MPAEPSPLEQKLVVAWKRWVRSPEIKELVMEKERVLAAFVEGEGMTSNELHDRITDLTRRGVGIEQAVRLSVMRLNG